MQRELADLATGPKNTNTANRAIKLLLTAPAANISCKLRPISLNAKVPEIQ